MSRKTTLPAAILAAAALVLGAAACGSPGGTTTTATAPAAATTTGAAITLVNGWAKASTGMTGAFGTLTNASDAALTITTATSDAAARTELHTMVKQPDGTMKMVQKEGGFVVPANGSVTLAPGGDHIMLIDLTKELKNGDQVRITLTATTGASFELTVPVRSFAGANESYLPGAGSTGMAH